MERDGDTKERKGEEAQQQEEPGAKRLKGTIGSDAFSCDACTQPLKPPIFQCPVGHFFLCSSCHDKQPGLCQVCAGGISLERSYGMERAIESFLVDCCYANHGCPEKTTYYDKESHRKACPHAPCFCPYSGCDFAGLAAELLDHVTAHHKCPCTNFKYWVQFDLPVKPGIHVLRCEDDGQLILLHTQPVEQPRGRGHAVSIVCVPPCDKQDGIECSVSFSCSANHSGTSTLHILPSSLTDCASTAMDYLCFVPKVSGGPHEGDAEVVLRINIVFADAADEDDSDDCSYIQSEDSGDSP